MQVHTVLIVDDTAGVRRALQRILTRAGYDVVTAADGAEAMRLASTRALHAVLVDYQMPGMDGLTLLSRLRALHPGAVRVLVSGALDMDVVMDAVNRGDVSGVLHKPFDSATVLATLRKGIYRRTASSQSWMASHSAQGELESEELRRLLHAGLTLGLQPIVDARTRKPVAFEGLLRTTSKLLPTPVDLIGAAEASHLEAAVTDQVARRAEAWLAMLPEDQRLFLNVHPNELADPEGLLESLSSLRAVTHRVVLEITERGTTPESTDFSEAIGALRNAGFGIAVDDLGAGSSSLSALAHIDPNVVKIDMSLVRDVDTDPRKQRLLDVICRFAAASDMEVVAEGIESADEADMAHALGATHLQGFFFGVAETDEIRIQRLASLSSLPPLRSQSGTRRRAIATMMAAVAGDGEEESA
ncbi:MAG: EAL domain-containing response regulator [Myxococcota bacterium]